MKKFGLARSPKSSQKVFRWGEAAERQRPIQFRPSKISTATHDHTDRFKFRTTSSSSIEQCTQRLYAAKMLMSKEYSFEDRTERKAETLETREEEPFRASYSRLSKLKSA